MSQPVKRGPGRPRKPGTNLATDTSDESDPRIGQSCDPGWSGVGYDDGSTYRCEDGVIVERVI